MPRGIKATPTHPYTIFYVENDGVKSITFANLGDAEGVNAEVASFLSGRSLELRQVAFAEGATFEMKPSLVVHKPKKAPIAIQTVTTSVLPSVANKAIKRRGGRPPGSKNKNHSQAVAAN